MYNYTFDPETGGILLQPGHCIFSSEPRPVYAEELNYLGLNEFWNYDKSCRDPYLFAEGNSLFYRGEKVARVSGGGCGIRPSVKIIENPKDSPLRPVDVKTMIKKNQDIMIPLIQKSQKNIYNTFSAYRNKVDVFYVAYSGGKDSEVTFDLVRRTLPVGSYKVLFADTQMEYPDTYEAVKNIKSICVADGTEFILAKANAPLEDSWKKFGPPSSTLRWCCNVHKTVPQILSLREATGKASFRGMAFIGVRKAESLRRSGYDFISYGKKHKGQYSCYPLLEWGSAEIYLYILGENLYLNKAYKKGQARVGCLLCPKAATRSEANAQYWYPEEFGSVERLVKDAYRPKFESESELLDYISIGGWKARKNGRDLSIPNGYYDLTHDKYIEIHVKNPKTNWKTWIRTIGHLLTDSSPYKIAYKDKIYSFTLCSEEDGYFVLIDRLLQKQDALFVRLLKNVFRRSAMCVGCHECEVDCPRGCISFENGGVQINDKCVSCAECHKVETGCLRYKSLAKPKRSSINDKESLNRYSHHTPLRDWIVQFFQKRDVNLIGLGTKQLPNFKKFLRDAEILKEGEFSETGELLSIIGLNSLEFWALILTNLSYTRQINWIVRNFDFNEVYSRDYFISKLIDAGAKESWAPEVWRAYSRMLQLPFSDIGYGVENKKGRSVISVIRKPWSDPDPLCILYTLYKSAEGDGNYSFSLESLFEDHENRISPVQLFGIDIESFKRIIIGLSENYGDYIYATFTHDLDSINLREVKTSIDILKEIASRYQEG